MLLAWLVLPIIVFLNYRLHILSSLANKRELEREPRLLCSVDCLTIGSIYTQHQCVTDRRTDGRNSCQ